MLISLKQRAKYPIKAVNRQKISLLRRKIHIRIPLNLMDTYLDMVAIAKSQYLLKMIVKMKINNSHRVKYSLKAHKRTI